MEKNEMRYSQLIDDEEPVMPEEEPKEEKEVTVTKKNFRRFRARDLLIILIPAVIAGAIVLFVTVFMKKAMSYTIEEKAYQNYGSDYEVPRGAVLTEQEDGSVTMNQGVGETAFPDLPIYYKDKMKLTLTKTMIYYSPLVPGLKRIDCFSDIEIDGNGSITASRNGESARLRGGFLFDGSNQYIFLEPMTVEINHKTYELGALSYAEANYNSDIVMYDHESGESYSEPTGNEAVARAGSDYSVSLLNDSMQYADGQKVLLFNRADLLKSVFE